MSASFWKQAACWWAEGQATCLLIVTHSIGSTPGRRGFHMLVRADGHQIGTVGGGIMERELVDRARALAGLDMPPQLLKRSHREDAAAEERSGMICAGSQWIALVPLAQSQPDRLAQLAQAASGSGGTLCVDPHGWRLCDEGVDQASQFAMGASWHWRERLASPQRVYVLGSGHVGLALCRVLALTDFEVVCIDHRAEVATFLENESHKHCRDYDAVDDLLQGGDRAYVVVVTTAYLTDIAALRAALRMDPAPRFIGLMGSATKIKRILSTLEAEGITSERMAAIKAPIGLEIGSETPMEIAISITAQLIQCAKSGPV